MIDKRKAIVVGAGVGGIATAIRLKVKGYEVDVFEKNSFAGGKLSEIRYDGYRFDAGPSLFTLPQLVDELFFIAGKDPRHYFKYEKLSVICKYFFEDGTILNAYQDVDEFAQELSLKTNVSKEDVRKFLKQSKLLYDLTSEVFIFNSFHKLKTFYSKPFIKAFMQLYKLKALTTMHKDNARFFKDQRVVQLFDRYATYNGSNPYTAPGTLNVIPHLEHSLGAFFPDNGMYSITNALEKLAVNLGVRFHFKTEVTNIKKNNRTVTGIMMYDEFLPADVVISDIDIVKLYKILDNANIQKRYLKEEKSTSALIFYWGMNKEFPKLELHNILFSRDYKKEFHHLFKTKTVYEDPTIYIFISSKKVKDDAPAGHENWFVMINTPENVGQEWDQIIHEMRVKIQNKIARMLKVDIQKHIVSEEILDPRTIESRTSSYNGSLYGSSSNNKFAAFKRHPNFSQMNKGLYFVGGSVHPGGGIPLCLASAKIVDDIISSS
jgi:phytoene desaturase